MRKARKQNGSLYLDANGSKTPVWIFSWHHVLPTGRRVRRKRQVGTLDQYKTEAAAERAVRALAAEAMEVATAVREAMADPAVRLAEAAA